MDKSTTSAVPATAGYSGGGATATATESQLSHGHGVNTGKEYQGSATGSQPTNTCEGIHAAQGGAGGPADHSTGASQQAMGGAQGTGSRAPTGSVLGAGGDAPVNVTPIAGQTMPENPTAQDKAKTKTAATVAGVQEDLKGVRDRLTASQASGEGSGKPSMMDNVKGFAVKTIDHTQAALEGAKQKVTAATTTPANTARET